MDGIIQNGVKVIHGSSYFTERGTIRNYNAETKKYLVEFDDPKKEPRWYEEAELTVLPKVEYKNFVGKAYKIWVLGMVLSLAGIFVGQWLGEYYKNPIVYYSVSGVWAAILGGASAVIGVIYIAKSKFE